jgi:two-component sensor histidine kinase
MGDSLDTETVSLLEKSHLYVDAKELKLSEVIHRNLFKPYDKPYINIGMRPETIWISFSLVNNSSSEIQKLLVLSSPMLENIALYTEENTAPLLNGRVHLTDKHTTLFYRYSLRLHPQEKQQYYLKVRSDYTPVDFALTLQNNEAYLKADMSQQLITSMLIGVIMALMFYSLLISFYSRDKSYLYYSFYLLALIYQQISYLGLTQIYLPLSFNLFDMKIPNFKGAFVLITSALFAMHFLKTYKIPMLNKLYKLFILFAFIEMSLLALLEIKSMYILAITVIVYITFNLIAGIISYLHGNKQARLFIVGFGIIFISYMMVVTDAIGLTSIMQSFQNALIWGTALEALILSLAFADRYSILQQEKKRADHRILAESRNRADLIQQEVTQKTHELNHALDAKELLIKEIHHRVKNNLQIILSITRLQNDETEDITMTKKLNNLESRINAISKTYNMLLVTEDIKGIDMQEYIDSLLIDIREAYKQEAHDITIETDITASLPLKESAYIGLIINELVTNAYKYAFDGQRGIIKVTLSQKKNHYILTVEDNGKGYTLEEKSNTLGLKLIHTLVYDQLEGEMKMHTVTHSSYTIRFTI